LEVSIVHALLWMFAYEWSPPGGDDRGVLHCNVDESPLGFDSGCKLQQ